MLLRLLAHNGIDHATHLESTTHQSGSVWWVVATSTTTVAVLYVAIRYLNRLQAQAAEDEEEEV